MLRIAVLYNQPQLPANHPEAASEWEIVGIAQLVAEELRVADWQPELWPAEPDFAWVQRLYTEPPHVVFNLFEGFGLGDGNEVLAAKHLEQACVPFTGNSATALELCRDKLSAISRLQQAGLPVPLSIFIESLDGLSPALASLSIEFPVFIKPAYLDASIGIDLTNVVLDRGELLHRASSLLQQYGPILIQEFLPGREFNVSVIEIGHVQVLPVSEIVFQCDAEHPWPVVTYSAKWSPGSHADRCTRPVCPASIDPDLERKLSNLARDAFLALRCRDYARIDLRLDRSGQPKILEVNPNPGYHPDAGFSRSLKAAGWSHAEFSRALVRQALTRTGFMK